MVRATLRAYEQKALMDVEQWERKKHQGFHKKILDITSKPVEYLINLIGPEKFHKFEGALERTIQQLLKASTHTIDLEELQKRARKHGVELKRWEDIRTCDLEILDLCNRENIDFHEKAAAIQGAVLGLGGALVAVADMTTILIQDFHMLQEIAFCYGYDPDDRIEKEIILLIIEAGLGGSEVKFKALKEIEALKEIKKKGLEAASAKGVSILGAKALEEYIEDLTVILLVRLVPRALPLISMAVSAHSNHEMMEHTGNTAFMVYRKRFIERKQQMQRSATCTLEGDS